MPESDQSDKETQDEIPTLEVSNESRDSNEHVQKRMREESSEDEASRSSSKKFCSIDKTTSEEHETEHTPEVNGTLEDKKDCATINASDNKEDTKCISGVEESVGSDTKDSYDLNFENKNEEASNTDTENKTVAEIEISMDDQKDNMSTKSETNVDTKDAVKKEETKEGEDDVKGKKKHGKSQVTDAEVVEGLELSVECASDKESSSTSESEDEKDKKPKTKTIIVKAKPNDSELDVSSSEVEKSDSQDASEVKSKESVKKGKKRGRTSFSKAKGTDSEENDNVSDEDYSPRTKRKLKKTLMNKKVTKSPSESKRGRGRGRKIAEKMVAKEEEEDEEEEEEKEEKKKKEDENSDTVDDKKAEESLSDAESSKSQNESESGSENASKDTKGRNSMKHDNNKKIQTLKKYIRAAGIHVKSYNDIWVGCKSNKAKITCLQNLLEKNGVSGRPTLEKCKKAKHRNEKLKDVAELNTSNIISEGRVTRAQRNKDSNKESARTPVKQREARNTYKRVLRVVDSDSE
ncbi:DNA ligase 1-like [Hylaeus volcanicus]|uniref:DNA ligase 1-like n=1 Tax=Hylaeus volcanicus TaxID=313075 RepID=UPI0023B777DE|nr:DNA ligase 1-like [Hylaeus volcanicus]XP_053972930.1 DNA ligase 1-like [Hylaeus volcanicus]